MALEFRDHHTLGHPWWKAKHGPRKYSAAFADWLVKEVSKDKHFLRRTRARWKRMPRA